MTCAPSACASCTAAVPTPPAAPWTSSRSPGRSPACVKSASWAVVKTSGSPPASGKATASGTGIELALVHDRELGLAAAADDPHHAIALGEARRARRRAPRRLAGQLEAGDVRRAAGRRGIAPAQLQHVGAVDAGRGDADEHLAGARLGVGVLLDEDLAVADRGGTHWRGV